MLKEKKVIWHPTTQGRLEGFHNLVMLLSILPIWMQNSNLAELFIILIILSLYPYSHLSTLG